MDDIRGKRIFVGLSGGVDSAVTAALLKREGAEVTAVFIKGWYPPNMPCSWASDRRDAMRVAARLQLPFVTLDAAEEYKRGVIDYLLREYAAGRTPNPDVMCNREVKFGAFARFAFAHGADLVATGHYARTNGEVLLRGVDEEKDQSYFLWAVPKEVMARTIFPLGGLHKSETRALAQKFKLPNATKKDSQGICFLGSISVDDFLLSEFGAMEGKAVDVEGRELGTHQGAMLHTLGERIALPVSGPWYVVRKDLERNILTVSHERGEGRRDTISLSEANYFITPKQGARLTAQFRYHGPSISGALSEDRTSFAPDAPLPEPAASGQSLVIYDGDRCVGGGIIG